MSKSTSDLHALAALVEAATPHVKHLGVNWIEANSLAFYEAASPDVVRELIDRVLRAEALNRKALSYLQEAFNSGNFEKTFDEVIDMLTAEDD